jgi:hypothetical protein
MGRVLNAEARHCKQRSGVIATDAILCKRQVTAEREELRRAFG